MAFTEVLSIVKNASYESTKVLTQAKVEELLAKVHNALDGVENLTFSQVQVQVRRDDDTPGS